MVMDMNRTVATPIDHENLHFDEALPSRASRLENSLGPLSSHTAMQLICLDYLEWLKNGRDVSSHLHCSQSSVSRQSASALQTFGLGLMRSRGEPTLIGDLSLLNETRRVYQLFRCRGSAELRIEMPLSIASQRAFMGIRGGLSIACTNPREKASFLRLLYERVIDIWITSDLPVDSLFDSICDPSFLSTPLAFFLKLEELAEAKTFYILGTDDALVSRGFRSLLRMLA